MGKNKKLSVKCHGQKLTDGDTVTVIITGKIKVSEYPWLKDSNEREVMISYGDDNEYYLNDAVNGKVPETQGLIVVKN